MMPPAAMTLAASAHLFMLFQRFCPALRDAAASALNHADAAFHFATIALFFAEFRH
jgi:hypothetical protein